MRLFVAVAVAGSVRLACPSWAGPAPPAPTGTGSMTTPVGAQPSPTMPAPWTGARPGHAASLTIQGVAPLQTTVTAIWTSAPLTFKKALAGIDVTLAWEDGGMSPLGADSQVLRVRYTDSRGFSKGRWGRWMLIDNPAFTRTPTDLLLGQAEVLDLGYPGRTPARGIRVQISLTDNLAPGTTLRQSLDIAAQ